MVIKYIILLLAIYYLQIANTQVTWTVQTGYYTTEIIQQPNAQFANWLKGNIENSLAQPRSGPFCDKETPDFPLNSQKICGVSAGKDICWKFEFTFKDNEAANYKLQVGGDFGRGMAMFVNGVPDVTIQSDVWWADDFNNPGVLSLDFDFSAGVNTITFYGGENCCEGPQSMRFQRNNGGWRIFTKANVLDVMPFVCTFPCQKCSMDPTNCYTCEGDHRNLSNGCTCQDGYYEDQDDQICKKCFNNCAICPSFDLCTESEPGYFVSEDGTTVTQCPNRFATCTSLEDGSSCQGNYRSSSLPCNCNTSYYDDLTNPDCVLCPLKYYKCSSPTVGIQCQGVGRSSITPDCLCNQGYYEAPGNNQDCVKCSNNCKQCENGSQCQICDDGYYLDGNLCTICPNKFTKCTSATVGTLCASGTGRTGIEPNCDCLPTYFDNNTNSANCEICIHPCQNCNTSNQNCETCVVRDFINDAPSCTCLTGYYEININDSLGCQKCQDQCKSCQISDDNCLECVNTANRNLKPNCQCKEGFYENEEFNCVPCIYPCQYCRSEQICLSCYNLENRNLPPLDSSSCSCKDGYYNKDNQCQECNYACELCIGESTNCVECSQEDRHGSLCKCNDGLYDDGVPECKICDYKCKTCISTSTNCIVCSEESRDQNNGCQCKQGFYEDQKDTLCKPCKFPCQNCINEFKCITCHKTGQSQLDILRLEPGCQCQSGYYEHPLTKNCLKCHSRCQECSLAPENCLECKKVPGRTNNVPLCQCKEEQFYPLFDEQTQTEQCLPCGPNCLTCLNADSCLTCINPRASGTKCDIIQQQQNSGIKLSVNVDGQMIEKEVQCKIQCVECNTTVENCISCSAGLHRTLIKPFCGCLQGYYGVEYTTDCLPCTKFCMNCKNGHMCQDCIPDLNRVVNKNSGLCECEQGFKDINGNCIKCYQYMKDCVIKCPKNTVQNENSFICIDTKVENQSNSNIILVMAGSIIALMVVGKILFLQVLKLSLSRLSKNSNQQNTQQYQQQPTSITDNSSFV